ncbi:MAG: phosphate acetyltransferase [Spirochaetes bacterium]|nr:phosphate acetyltransferase [Spirochaetota bacterium]
MSAYIETIKAKAKKLQRRIVLPEGTDIRPLKAAEILIKDGTVKEVVIVGDPDAVRALAKQNSVSIDGATIIDPKTAPEREDYIEYLFNRRKEKGMTKDQARDIIENKVMFFGAALVAKDRVDGMVGGCIHPTADMIRSTLFLVGLKPGNKTISSFFIMIHPDRSFFNDGVFMYADCGVVPNPTAEQLADIAEATAGSYRSLVADDPRVALLSFSTKGSATDPIVDKVIEAKKLLDTRKPNFPYDGELQFDAAMMPDIAKRKSPGSPIEGKANIFIFPDLNAGNICYKATERLAKCAALGPILQGGAKPMNDLSRGCSAQDIAEITLITALQV